MKNMILKTQFSWFYIFVVSSYNLQVICGINICSIKGYTAVQWTVAMLPYILISVLVNIPPLLSILTSSKFSKLFTFIETSEQIMGYNSQIRGFNNK